MEERRGNRREFALEFVIAGEDQDSERREAEEAVRQRAGEAVVAEVESVEFGGEGYKGNLTGK